MKKNVIILVLFVVSVISLTSLKSMSSRAAYWMNRCDTAESVINRVEYDNPEYVLAILCESDEWNNWLKYNPDI